jgi:hypothetical protein
MWNGLLERIYISSDSQWMRGRRKSSAEYLPVTRKASRALHDHR